MPAFWWAVSAVVLPVAGPPATVQILDGERVVAIAALVDARGLFLAPPTGVADGRIRVRAADREPFYVRFRASDPVTKLVLLQSEKGLEGLWTVVPLDPEPSGRATVIGPDGTFRAQIVSGQRLGVLSEGKRRLVSLREVRLGEGADRLRGALVFTGRGLVGPLVSTLDTPLAQTWRQNAVGLQNTYGPAPLQVAYATGPDTLRRVVDGFRSPNARVDYPYVGLVCRDALGGGAEVVQVAPGSPAEKFRIAVGDVLLTIGGTQIRDQFDFGLAASRLAIGERVIVALKRGDRTLVTNLIAIRSGD